jgi:hypothetical protein
MRGNRSRRTLGRFRNPWLAAPNQSTEDVRPCSLKIAPNLLLRAASVLGQVQQSHKNARSAKSGRAMTSSMPLRMTGRAA